MDEKIGVFICECGPNIKDAVDLDQVMFFTRDLKAVEFVGRYNVLCSREGKAAVENDIINHGLTRVVIAGCSPKEHERTFREVLLKAGVNPFLLQMANIREQCAWVIKDKLVATKKAKAIINASISRVICHEPLEVSEIECNSDVLVLGAGIAGMSAALSLAQKERKVYLVERLPCIGGKVPLFEDVFPDMGCASCVLDPLMDEVLNHDRIEVFTYSEVLEVLGSYGRFLIKVRKKATSVDFSSCIGCGACFEVCPIEVRNEYNAGLDYRKAIYIPYPGSLPNKAVIERGNCLRLQGQDCEACRLACPFGSIDFSQQDQLTTFEVGAAILATGFDIFDPIMAPQYGYGEVDDIYTALEFERLLNSNGPTGGEILLRNGTRPGRIAFIHCVGSRSASFNEYCSGICCGYMLKLGGMAEEKLPGVSITHLYSDLCLPGKSSQGFFNSLSRSENFRMLRIKGPDSVDVSGYGGRPLVSYTSISGKIENLTADMVVLATAIEGAKGAGELGNIFDITMDSYGFFAEQDTLIGPVSSQRDGIFIAGCAKGPRDAQVSSEEGRAAAGAILSRLVPGERLSLEAMSAEVIEELCSGCRVCADLCLYKAIEFNGEFDLVSINPLLCRGCGICVAACPAGAIRANHYTDIELSEEIKGLLEQL